MKIITLLFAVLVSAVAGAQITYDSSDFATYDDTFDVNTASGFLGMNFSVGGANHNWNFSGMSSASTDSFGYMNPADAGYKLAWCFTNGYFFNCNNQFNNSFKLAQPIMQNGISFQDYGVNNMIAHIDVNGSEMVNKMVGITANISGIDIPMTVDYQTPDVVYHFPIVYNDSYTTSGFFDLDLTSLGLPFHYSGEVQRENTVQGWGSLVTPGGSFPNVLQVKSVTTRTDTIEFNGIAIPVPSTTVSYQWFDKNYGMPVLQADGMELFNFFVPITVTYLEAPALQLTEQAYNPDVQLYPNPTSGVLQLTKDNLDISDISVYNSIGMLVGKSLDISSEANGMYFVKITTPDGWFVRKAIKN